MKSTAKASGWSIFRRFLLAKANRTTIGLQNRQNLPSPSHIFASILQVRQAARSLFGYFREPPFGYSRCIRKKQISLEICKYPSPDYIRITLQLRREESCMAFTDNSDFFV